MNDLELVFVNLNTEFVELKSKIDIIIKKYEDLEDELENQSKSKFKCSSCSKKFEELTDLQNHKKEEGTCQANFKCEECGKTFRSENQLDIHKKKHIRFECEDCECEYRYEGLLEKHNQAVHRNVKIFCHYFNNDKDCPFDDQCIFAHDEAPACKFGGGCERILCMFQHEDDEESEDEDNNQDEDNDDEEDVNESIDEENVISIDDIEPSMRKVEEAMEKVNQLLKQQKLKCDVCEFQAKNMNGLNMHNKAKHTDNSK